MARHDGRTVIAPLSHLRTRRLDGPDTRLTLLMPPPLRRACPPSCLAIATVESGHRRVLPTVVSAHYRFWPPSCPLTVVSTHRRVRPLPCLPTT